MKDDHNIHPEIIELLERFVDGELRESEHTRINQLLRTDDLARDTYLLYFAAHGELCWDTTDHKRPIEQIELSRGVAGQHAPSTTTSKIQSTPRPKSLLDRASRYPLMPSIGVALVVLVALLVGLAFTPVGKWIAGEGGKDAESRQRETPTDSEFVAILNSRHSAVWLDDSDPSLSDPRLKVGKRLSLESGMIEVKYYSGVCVVIEGPAEFWVGGTKAEGAKAQRETAQSSSPKSSLLNPNSSPSNSGFLRLGSLVARIEGEKAKGFAIDTPSARIEDFGTEFGVEVDEQGATKFVVLSGEVDVVSDDGEGLEQRVRLTKDQGAFVATAGGGITRRNNVDTRLMAAMRSRLEIIGRVPTGPIFREGFSRTTIGSGEGIQFQTGLDLRVGNAYPGWTITGKSHAVDLDSGRGRNWAAMIWNEHSITSPPIAANEQGTTYRVDFDGGPGVYADGSQITGSQERVKFEVLNGSNEVIHTEVCDPTDWGPPSTGPGLLILASHGFAYDGDGQGHIRIRISPAANNDRFSGTIDNLSVSAEMEGNVSLKSGSEADGEATKEADSAEQGSGE